MPASGNHPVDLLLIEDDPQAAKLFIERTNRFAPGKFNVTQARSLQAGLDEASDFSFGLAVLDLTLPDSSGIETCSKFSSAQPEIPFVVLTGVDDSSLIHTISRAGAKAALVKGDCSAQELIDALKTAAVAPKFETSTPSTAVAEARFRNAVVDSADGIIVLDETTRIQLVSAGAEQLLGRSAADLAGSELGIELTPGEPFRAQMVREETTHVDVHRASGAVKQFDSCQLNVTEVEFWPFTHRWSGKQVTVCALRDITNQSAEESRIKNVRHLDRPLQVGSGIDDVCADLAAKLGPLIRFNRFEAAIWRPEFKRLQVIAELGIAADHRQVSQLIEGDAPPVGFGSWMSEWSVYTAEPRIAVSIGCVEPGAYDSRDKAILSRCADLVAEALREMKSAPVLSRAHSGLGASIVTSTDIYLHGAA